MLRPGTTLEMAKSRLAWKIFLLVIWIYYIKINSLLQYFASKQFLNGEEMKNKNEIKPYKEAVSGVLSLISRISVFTHSGLF